MNERHRKAFSSLQSCLTDSSWINLIHLIQLILHKIGKTRLKELFRDQCATRKVIPSLCTTLAHVCCLIVTAMILVWCVKWRYVIVVDDWNIVPIGDPRRGGRGGAKDVCSLSVKFSSILCSFLKNLWLINKVGAPTLRVGAPPQRLANPSLHCFH